MKAIEEITSQIQKVGLMEIDLEYFFLRAKCYFEVNKYKESIEDLNRFISKSAKNQNMNEAYVLRGNCYLKLGLLDEAKINADASKNKKLLNDLKPALNLIKDIESYKEKKEFRKALDLYKKLLSICESSVSLMIQAADCALLLGDEDEYNEISTSAVQMDSNNPELLLLRGRKFFCDVNYDFASRHFKRCAQTASSNSNLCSKYLRQTREYEKLQTNFNVSISENNYDAADSIINQSLVVAEAACAAASSLYFNSKNMKVKLLIAQKRYKEALSYASELIRTYPNSSLLYLERGKLNYLLGDKDNSAKDYQTAVKIDPYCREAEEGLRSLAKDREDEKNVDYYKLLNLSRSASASQIKEAYRKAARVWHPDRFSDPVEKKEAEKNMRRINRAWDILSDPEKKRMYDQGIDPDNPQVSNNYNNEDHYQDFHNPFEQFGFGRRVIINNGRRVVINL